MEQVFWRVRYLVRRNRPGLLAVLPVNGHLSVRPANERTRDRTAFPGAAVPSAALDFLRHVRVWALFGSSICKMGFIDRLCTSSYRRAPLSDFQASGGPAGRIYARGHPGIQEPLAAQRPVPRPTGPA